MRKNQVVGTKKYFLKSKDKIILSFDISQEIDNYKITTYHCQNIVLSEHEELLPKGMMIRDKTESGLQHWFEKRKASEHRPNSLRFLNCGGSPGDLLRYLEINRGMSLNDTYWVAPVGEDIRWGEVSPYSNVLDKEIADIAFTNEFKIEFPESKLRITAEPTTAGMLRKCWVNKGERIYLRKAYEPQLIREDGRSPIVMEYFANQVADVMKIKHIPYFLSRYMHPNGESEVICECPLFTSENIGFVSAIAYIDEAYLASTGQRWECESISARGVQMTLAELFGQKYYADMMLFDTIILNYDRHFGNFGYLVNNNNGKYIGPAPLFDNGNTLLATAYNISDYDMLMDDIWNQYARFMPFDLQAYYFVEDRHLPVLKKLAKFKFKQPVDSSLRVSEQAIEQMSNIVQIRSKKAIELLKKKARNLPI